MRNEIIKYVGAVVVFTIMFWFTVLPLEGLGFSGDNGIAGIVVSFILASAVFVSTCFYWEKSAVIRVPLQSLVYFLTFIGVGVFLFLTAVYVLLLMLVGIGLPFVLIGAGALLLLFFTKRIVVKIICGVVFTAMVLTLPVVMVEQRNLRYTPLSVLELSIEDRKWVWRIATGWNQGYYYGAHFHYVSRSPRNEEEKLLCSLLSSYYSAQFSEKDFVRFYKDRFFEYHRFGRVASTNSLPYEERVIVHPRNSSSEPIISVNEKSHHLRTQVSEVWYPFEWEERIILHHRNSSIAPDTDATERSHDRLLDSWLGHPSVSKNNHRWFLLGVFPVYSHDVRSLTHYVWDDKLAEQGKEGATDQQRGIEPADE